MSAKHHNTKKLKEHKRVRPVTQQKTLLRKIWHFIWYDDSLLSWLVNLVIAFLLIKFLIYPLLGVFLGSELPVVAVISGSMDHTPRQVCLQQSLYTGECISYDATKVGLCGQIKTEQRNGSTSSFDTFWNYCGSWYENRSISKAEFKEYPLSSGFEKGDVIVLKGVTPKDLEIGDVLVFTSGRPYPIIHRIVTKEYDAESEQYVFGTKGDFNPEQINTLDLDETTIQEYQIVGKGVAKIPYVGYVKIVFVQLLEFLRIV